MTLTEVSYNLRKLLPYAILGILIFFILFYAVQLLFLFFGSKKPPPQINPIFGPIKEPFIKDASKSAGIKFKLDTIEGRPVSATDAAKVFFLPQPTTRFGYREKVFLMAKTFGFDTNLVKYRLVGSQAIFQDERQKLTIDITNFNFNYQYLFENEPEIFETVTTPTTQESQETAIEFLQSVGRYPEEFTQGELNTIFFFYNKDSKTFTQLERNINSNVAEVDFFRPKVDEFPIVSPKFTNSQNFVLLVFNDFEFRILKAQVAFFEKSPEQIGIYPVKTGSQAYDDLKNGKAIVVSNPEGKKDITIKKMFLGYLDPDVYQEYLAPVYVFLGEGNFVAYVPAVTDEYLTD